MTFKSSRRDFMGGVVGTVMAPSILLPANQSPAAEPPSGNGDRQLIVDNPNFSLTKITPFDPQYEAKSMGYNQRFIGHPKYIQVCGSPHQVLKAVQRAVDENLRMTIRGGGHCYEGFVSDNTGGGFFDLSFVD